jgi:ethanolaminephosphotransferase
MSSTASNYDMTKLITGQAVAAVALILSLAATSSTIANSLKSVTPFLLIAVAYSAMMFASSYVEEEQHFWYWATTGWLVLLWVKKYVPWLHV